MADLTGRVVLVTGASSGIGLAAAEALAQRGLKVIACARNIQKIQDANKNLASNPIQAVKTDMTSEQEVLALFKEINDKYGRLDILINNAGIGGTDTLLEGNFAGWKAMTDLNVLALTLAAREAVKLIEAGKSQYGHIININSVVGHKVTTGTAGHFYSATKHMVTALTEGLRKSAQPKNIRVTSISPGVVQTDFFERAFGKNVGESIFSAYKCLEPRDIADAIIYVLGVPAHVNIDELTITPLKQHAL
ncbi:Dehydrogenase/reductase SDR family member 11 [Hypsibius exemplaris]|uniref:Dehydrogenase/reductase SDR family member 11 n=1 Tax=Hypsibius exemplaris TaxID=2072580 RepID=A0A9X6NG14_HYPEX|nr:Dehydrogenase/reductase SDR family member 11 [Hypsibius exemplaris]